MNGTPSFANPANLEPKTDQAIELAPDGTSLDLLKAIYHRADLPLSTRMRAATAALPHEHPKLAVTTVINAGDFADQLEKAIERSRKIDASLMIEGNVSSHNVSSESTTANVPTDTKPHVQASNGGAKPMTIPDRRYRKW